MTPRRFFRLQANGICALFCAVPFAAAQLQAQQPAPPAAIQAPAATGIIVGSITDPDGGEIPGAHLSLVSTATPTAAFQTTSEPDGQFILPNIPAGPYTITVSAEGFVTTKVPGALPPNETLDLPPIILAVGANQSVQVTATQEELAEAEIKIEEKQRLIGIIPNFYVVYDWKAPPLDKRQKFELGWKSIIDPANLLINAGIAGVEQATNTLPGYGPGIGGYGKRLGALNADVAVGTFLGGVALPILFKQDPRYFYLGRGTILHRTLYAFSTCFIARGDNGKWQPAYASLLGDFGSGAISNIYYPAGSKSGAEVTITNGAIAIISDGVNNIIQEFVLKHFTPHAATYPNPVP